MDEAIIYCFYLFVFFYYYFTKKYSQFLFSNNRKKQKHFKRNQSVGCNVLSRDIINTFHWFIFIILKHNKHHHPKDCYIFFTIMVMLTKKNISLWIIIDFVWLKNANPPTRTSRLKVVYIYLLFGVIRLWGDYTQK